jgi:glutamate-5-semialdehyde dehydrogenase
MKNNSASQSDTGVMSLKLKDLREAQKKVSLLSESQRSDLLGRLALLIAQRADSIMEANNADLMEAQKLGLSSALMDRLKLDLQRIKGLEKSLTQVAAMPPVLGQVLDHRIRSDGLVIRRKTIPIGVILFIFESRPNVIIDAISLGLKSGNAMILKGGKEAKRTLQVLGQCIYDAWSVHGLEKSVWVLVADDRHMVQELLAYNRSIDLVIPRGGPDLVTFVRSHTQIPVIAHDKGLCHMYVHQDAPEEMALELTLNGKVQRPGVCNALETLIIHKNWPLNSVKMLCERLLEHSCELRLDPDLLTRLDSLDPKWIEKNLNLIKKASVEDWDTEHLSLILNIKQIDCLEDALSHIARYGSHHTEVICTQDELVAEKFITNVDASCVGVNASTRFNDGGELGLGAEIGISTSKIHAFGPMGAMQLTSSRFEILGQGHLRR